MNKQKPLDEKDLPWVEPTNKFLKNINVGGEKTLMKKKPLLTSYIKAAMSKTVIEKFDDGSFYAEIPECVGLWANEDSIEDCIGVIREALEEWIMIKLIENDPLPIIDDIEIGKVVEENCNL